AGPAYLRSAAFSPDGKLLAGGFNDRFRLWDLAAFQEIHPFGPAPTPGTVVAFSPDGKLFASGENTRSVVPIWHLDGGKPLHRLELKGTYVVACAFAPDSRTLAVACGDNLVHLWDAATGQEIRRLKGHEDMVLSLAFSSDGKTLASGGGVGDRS